MTSLGLLLPLVLLGAPEAPTGALRLEPVLRAGFAIFGDDGMGADMGPALGLGGGVGACLVWHDRWLLQADGAGFVGPDALGVFRVAAGAQRQGVWAPAAWLALSRLWYRLGSAYMSWPPRTEKGWTWVAAVRLSPLRFAGKHGTISVLEAGLGAGPRGGYSVDVDVLQASRRW